QAQATVSPSAAEARRAIEGPQADPGEDGLGELSIQELMDRFGVPGVSVAVVHDFDVHWARGYGIADVETGQPVDTETMFQAASISKPVAAMGVLAAVEDGVFGLDDDINDVLRSWTLNGDGFTGRSPVTPRTLTSHTSGLGDGFGFPGYEPDDPIPTAVQILEGHETSNVGPVFMEREPMSLYEYSGGGVTVMQVALADARGRPFEDVLRDDVLAPIGMTRSSFRQPIAPEHDRNAARAHGREGESMGPKWHVYPEQAAAGLWTTPTDLARFVLEVQRALRGDADRAISRASAMEMTSPVGVGPYGVGFSVRSLGEGWYFGHGGSNWGFRATILGHRAKGYGYAIMTNASQGSAVAGEIARRIQRAYGWDSMAEPVARGYGSREDVVRMTDAAQAFLASLSDEQRASATFPFDSDERLRFHFIPNEMFERSGVMLADLDEGQRERAHDLLRSGLSRSGYLTAVQIMELEDVLLALEGGRRFARDRDEYLVSVFGTPGPDETWGWRFEGHHLSLHFTVVDGSVGVLAPAFAGANPAEVREGPQQGRRVLGDREDAGRALARSLSADQLREATIAAEAPRDIVTGAESDIDPLAPEGIAAAELDEEQRRLLIDLVNVYLESMAEGLAQERGRRIGESGIDAITFGWAGGLEPGVPHYYRVQGPTFLIEYDNTQNGANHIHSVWRDFEGDFGRDLLREHRARTPHEPGR
ncbi:MAG: DUF3500 domain-containing protein, partial [Longimicrobiales bacterium]|nr:DUF3500 domain-containing protein [Longimicrobiales bacterium]